MTYIQPTTIATLPVYRDTELIVETAAKLQAAVASNDYTLAEQHIQVIRAATSRINGRIAEVTA